MTRAPLRQGALAALTALAALLAGCVNDGTADGPVQTVSYGMATYQGGATFALALPDDAPEATLTAAGDVPWYGGVAEEAGTRVLMGYRPAHGASPYASGSVEVVAVSPVTQGPVKVLTPDEAADDPQWADTDPVWVTAVWRTGSWLNMRLKLPYATEPRVFGLVTTDAPGSPEPAIRLVHRMPQGVSAETTFLRQYYASFDMGALWTDPATEAVTLHVDNSNIPALKVFTFSKQ